MRGEETQSRETGTSCASALSISDPPKQITHPSVSNQATAESAPAVLVLFGEVSVIAQYLRHLGVLATIEEQVRFARRRFGYYDVIDFVVVLLGYAISGERTLEAFYESVHPFAIPFMALFERDRLPARSTLSRFLGPWIKLLLRRCARCFSKACSLGLWRRRRKREGCGTGKDSIGTRQAARQRALPSTPDLPPAQRRLDEVCAPGYTGHKRGETVRTRTTVLQAHTHQWLGTFSGASGAGNGDYRVELRQAVKAITA